MDWPPAGLEINTKGLEKYHHLNVSPDPVEMKTLKICRCWHSKKFPYCDDTHKVMVEAGDNVGPYVAKIHGRRSNTQNVGSNKLQLRTMNKTPRGVMFAMGCGAGAAAWWVVGLARGNKFSVDLQFEDNRAPVSSLSVRF
uniref:Iron-binding zinc finger CDGSH type domain-containing protein n=1 Tax=Noctiluca scintillans TaxID=2966 RepID=A0A7S1FAJ8_NOCSC|mmetsp:Transcript_47879/g.126752  ORF Transcript_47879/g.126752 Transcript_47879/m.126752 type:complete len:140 (-) Transcript_47879:62-481(-)